MHILLTGEIQVGKTTIIQKFLSQSGLSADGFMTYWTQDDSGNRSLYLSPYSTGLHIAERHLIACSADCTSLRTEKAACIFDVYGSEILSASGKQDVIVMDELGRLESEATVFQAAVMRHILSDVPILGVIKPAQTEFLGKIRAHPAVETHEVTLANRDSALKWLLKRYRR